MWYQRISKGKDHYLYVDVDTQAEVTNEEVLKHIEELRIPKGYHNVMIHKNARAKVLAYGYDNKGRKQVIYSPWFVAKQAKKKFARVYEMDKFMPKLLERISNDATSTHIKNKEIAVIIYLIIACGFRIGNDKYATSNQSYGLTTLEKRHIRINKSKGEIQIRFIGKKGVENVGIITKESAPIIYSFLVKACRHKEKTDQVFSVSSDDVNNYLREMNPTITSKDIRTWNANNIFLSSIKECVRECPSTNVNRVLNLAIDKVATHLHHTRDVCKKNYLHPDILEVAKVVIQEEVSKPSI
jgi:DNA topoisomerase-1